MEIMGSGIDENQKLERFLRVYLRRFKDCQKTIHEFEKFLRGC